MRLIKLELLNLASLDRQEGEVIHFEEGALKDSTIFSIVGPTGSGKSTLLDAICLALYNRAPRYPRKKGDRNQNIEIYGEMSDGEKNRLAPTDCRNILTRGKKTGFSKLTFLANNGQLYRAEWHVKFMQVNFAPVVTALYKLTEKEGKLTEETAEWDALPQIIGLDYEQFLRTVLIAQGSFANFLTAKENERYELLEKLIGCEDLYSRISADIKTQKDAAVKAYDTIQAHFSAYEKDLMSSPELEALTEEIRQLEATERKEKEELVKTNEALGWYVTEKQHQTQLQEFRQKQIQALQAWEAAQGEFQRLKWHDETLPGMELFRDMKRAESNRERLKEQIDALNKQLSLQQDKIKEGEAALQRLKVAETKASLQLETQRPHINRARILQGELEIARLSVQEKEKAWKAGYESLQKAQKEQAVNQAQIEKAKQDLVLCEEAFRSWQEETNRRKQALEEEVNGAKEAFEAEHRKLQGVNAHELQQTKDQAEQQLNHLLKAVRTVEEWRLKQQQLMDSEVNYRQLSIENQQLDKEEKALTIESLATELETLQKTHTLMTSENWTLHRQHLEEGKPCPLCGATAHPYTHQETWVPVISELQTLIKQKKTMLDEQTRRRQQLTEALGMNNGKLQSLRQQQITLHREIEKRQEEWQSLAEIYPTWTADASLLKQQQPALEQKGKTASEALSAYHHTQTEADKRRQIWEAGEQKRKRYAEESDRQGKLAEQKRTDLHTYLQTEWAKMPHLQQLVTEKTEAEQQLKQEWQRMIQAVTEKEGALKKEIGLQTPDALEQQLMQAKNQASEEVNRQHEILTTLREGLKGLHGNREATLGTLNQESELQQQLQKALQQWLTDFNEEGTHTPISTVTIEELSTATDPWEEIRRRQSALQTELTTAQTTLTNQEKAHEAHQKQKPEQQQEELLAKKNELECRSHTALTDAKARYQRHEAAKQQMGQLFHQRQAALLEKQEWEEITDAIGGDGKTLRKIAQCYTLRFLIEHANAEIRKFNQRYELQQVKNSLGIRVIDHDRADDIRDTTSLSGGETFIVSLGLALGLSALSSRNISFENLFIDEGFGTLDPDTLATVIDSLAMLQSSQGKKVGVISHTDTMSERITTQIRIIKNGHSGSSHLEIYP